MQVKVKQALKNYLFITVAHSYTTIMEKKKTDFEEYRDKHFDKQPLNKWLRKIDPYIYSESDVFDEYRWSLKSNHK